MTPADQTSEAPQSRRRRSRRTPFTALGRDLRALAAALDDVLVVVEDAAWAVRRVADSAGDVARVARDRSTGGAGDASRLVRTGTMLAELALAYRMHRFRAAFTPADRAARDLDRLHARAARRFQATSREHGGAFLKVGQLLSGRGDLLPEVWVRELEALQDRAPELPFEVVRDVLEAELGAELAARFAELDEAPRGSASIGQVHHARLADGRRVAVKVQRPGIGRRIEQDLDLLGMALDSLRGTLPDADWDTIVGELREKVLAEVDYPAEVAATREVALGLAGSGAMAPLPVEALCTERVIVTEWVDGEKLTVRLDALEARAAEGDSTAKGALDEILGRLLGAYLRQVLEIGTFQADPHPGNLMVAADGRVVVLDYGCAGRLGTEQRQRYLSLLSAIFLGDRDRTVALLRDVGFRTKSGRPDTLLCFADALLGELRQAAGGSVVWPTREQLGARLSGLLSACEDDPVTTIPGDFVMIARVFATLGGLFTRYRPDLDFGRHVAPVIAPALVASMFPNQDGEAA